MECFTDNFVVSRRKSFALLLIISRYTKLNDNLDEMSAVTDFPSSGEERWPTAGVVTAATNA